MRHNTTKGHLKWSHTIETQLSDGVWQAVTISGKVDYTFTPGSPATGPTYSCGGTPAEPAEVEYYNFRGEEMEVVIGRENQDTNFFSHTIKGDNGIGEWFEKLVENDDKVREYLDEKASEDIDGRNEPPDRDDWED